MLEKTGNLAFKNRHTIGIIAVVLYILFVVIFPSVVPISGNKVDGNVIASYIYGMTTPLFGILTIFFVYRTYGVQKKQLDDTTEQLANNTKALQQQRFEDNFFRLLENHHHLVEAMIIRDGGQIVAEKRECFRVIWDYMDMRNNTEKGKNVPVTPEIVNEIYNETQERYKSQLHNYFRFIYHTLKFIKNAKGIDDKMRYSNILRATLSPYEICLIHYNGIHKFGSGLHPLIEQFSFLKNRDESLYLLKRTGKEYHPLAFAPVNDRPKQLSAWKIERKMRLKPGIDDILTKQ